MLKKELKYLLLIILIFIAACIETDIYLPAFTDMMVYFQVSADQIQSILSWNFIGICLSGPLYGPISDSFGRRKPLFVALGLFFMGSLVTLCADNFTVMLFGRLLQGLGCGGCFTLGTTIIFDSFSGEKAVKALAKINSIVPFIMAAAPIAGGYLNEHFGFRSNFLTITIIVFISLVATFLFFSETLSPEKRVPFSLNKIAKNFKTVCLSLPFWQNTMIVCSIFAGYITFLSGISVLFVLDFGISKESLPCYQAALLGAWLMANFLCSWALSRFGLSFVKNSGIYIFLTGGILLLLAVLIAPKNPYFLTLSMVFYSFGANWVQGVYFPEVMGLFPEIKGVTASIISSTRLLISAAAVSLASGLYNSTIYPYAGVIFVVITINLTAILFYEKGKRSQAAISQT